MNAILCDIEVSQYLNLPDTFSRTGATVPERKLEARCPHCDSIIYSRRHKLCGVCAEELPDNCRFDSEQAENVKLLLREEKIRHRAWMQRSVFAN